MKFSRRLRAQLITYTVLGSMLLWIIYRGLTEH
jgi:hypothetical protein